MEHHKASTESHTVVIVNTDGEAVNIEMEMNGEEMSVEVNMQGEFAWGPGPVMSVPFTTGN